MSTGQRMRNPRPRSWQKLKPDFADPAATDNLVEAAQLYTGITQIIRLCLNGDVKREDFPPGLC